MSAKVCVCLAYSAWTYPHHAEVARSSNSRRGHGEGFDRNRWTGRVDTMSQHDRTRPALTPAHLHRHGADPAPASPGSGLLTTAVCWTSAMSSVSKMNENISQPRTSTLPSAKGPFPNLLLRTVRYVSRPSFRLMEGYDRIVHI